MKQTIVIATRQSLLAMTQAELVKQKLLSHYPNQVIELLPMTTTGDEILDQSLSKIGGKGLFVKELEKALLDGRADIAVHSMKDVPMMLPDGLTIPCMIDREDPRDVLVSNTLQSIDQLSGACVVGTSSTRRAAQLLSHYPHLTIKDLRGNVQTRLKKLEEGQYDAIVLAAAGLIRLDLLNRIQAYFPVDQLLPSPGQGALGVECRAQDAGMIEMLSVLHDQETEVCVQAERRISVMLDASCQLPLASFAQCDQGDLSIQALVATPDGSKVIKSRAKGPVIDADALSAKVAEELLAQGGRDILEACR
jgi:hydroxymethylbilane synthase